MLDEIKNKLKPIESAPQEKDILVWDAKNGLRIGRYIVEAGFWQTTGLGFETPTHWTEREFKDLLFFEELTLLRG